MDTLCTHLPRFVLCAYTWDCQPPEHSNTRPRTVTNGEAMRTGYGSQPSRRIPLPSLPLKYRRKSQSLSDYEDEAPVLHRDSDYSSASSSPIATSAALASDPNSPTEYSHTRREYYYAFNNSQPPDASSFPSSYTKPPFPSHTPSLSPLLRPLSIPHPPSSFPFPRSPYRPSTSHRSFDLKPLAAAHSPFLAPDAFDLDASGYSEDMDVDNGQSILIIRLSPPLIIPLVALPLSDRSQIPP